MKPLKVCMLAFVLAISISAVAALATDTTAPGIILGAPADNYWDLDGIVNFTYTPSDASNISYCKLIANGSIKDANYSVARSKTNYFKDKHFSDGNYTWYITCMDEYSNVGNSGSRNLLIEIINDVWAPNITLTSPPSGSDDYTGVLNFTYVPHDNLSNITNCELIVDDVVKDNDTSITNGTSNKFLDVALNDGTRTWWVNCTDNKGNEGSSEKQVVVVEAVTIKITVNSPTNKSTDKDGIVTFTYTPVSSYNLSWCFLKMNTTANTTTLVDYTIFNNTDNSFYYINMTNGTWDWTVNCTDTAGHTNITGRMILYVNLLASASEFPHLTLNSPADGYTDLDGQVTFKYTVNHTRTIASCELIANNTVLAVDSNITRNAQNEFSKIMMDNGSWSWMVQCADSSGNEAISLYQDLNVNAIYSPPVEVVNETNATNVTNITEDNITNVTINETINETISGKVTNFITEHLFWVLLGTVIIALSGFAVSALMPMNYRKRFGRIFQKEKKKKFMEGRFTKERRKQLIAYIGHHLEQGYSMEEIREHLIAHNWKENHIQKVFRQIHRERKKKRKK